jgi:hypothetical protein
MSSRYDRVINFMPTLKRSDALTDTSLSFADGFRIL